MSAHEFITVKNRRWCLGCDLFQQKQPTAAFFPTPRKPCPETTPHARIKREKARGDAKATAKTMQTRAAARTPTNG